MLPRINFTPQSTVPRSGGVPTLFDWGEDTEYQAPEPVQERGWFERVLAPFEAPQQFLFSLTQEVADDGFQVSDVWTALKHGANYFNPWSDAERISEDEILDIFGGSKFTGAGRFAANLGISLLYDPLFTTGAMRLTGKGLKALGATAAADTLTDPATLLAVDRVTNPARNIMDAAGVGGRYAAALGDEAATALFGAERWADVKFRSAMMFRAPSKLMTREWYESVGRVETRVQEWQGRAASIIKTAENAGPKASDLLTEAIENKEVYNALMAKGQPTKVAGAELSALVEKINDYGLDKDLFLDSLQQWYDLNHTIEGALLATGRLTPEASREMAGRYLRNQYTLKQSPVDHERRLAQLERFIESGQIEPKFDLYKSHTVFHDVKLREQLTRMSEHLQDARPRGNVPAATEFYGIKFQTEGMGVSSVQRRYFPRHQNSRDAFRFNVDNFMEDFGAYMNSNPTHSLEEAMAFIKNDMFGGIQPPSEFMAVLGDYMAKGMVDTKTIPELREMIAQGRAAGQTTIRNYSENMKVIIDRLAIPDEIADHVLGRIDTALPRISDYASTVGREVSIEMFFDEASGAVRLTEDFRARMLADMQKASRKAVGKDGSSGYHFGTDVSPEDARRFLSSSPEIKRVRKQYVDELVQEYPWMTRDEARSIVNRADSGTLRAGDIIGFHDGIATEKPIGANSVLVPRNQGFGSLEGKYVPPSVYHTMQQMTKFLNDPRGMDPKSLGQNFLDKIEALTSTWKMAKIVWDAGAQMRDMIGSLLQMEVMGINMFKPEQWKKALNMAREASMGRLDGYAQTAYDIGYDIFGSSLVGAELSRKARAAAGYKGMKSVDWIDDTKGVLQGMMDFAEETSSRAATMYQNRENLYRAYTYIHKTDELTSAMVSKLGRDLTREETLNVARQAADFTNRTLYNYADIPAAMNVARTYGIAPFITFPAKATGQLIDVLYHDPWRLLKYDRTLDAWNTAWAGGDEAFAAEIAALPTYMRDNLVVRLPWESKEGEPLYFDLSYILPWAAVRDLSDDAGNLTGIFRGASTDDVPNEDGIMRGSYPGAAAGGGIFSPVITQITDIFQNRDGFGRRIWKDTDSTEQKIGKISRQLWQFMAPPTAPGGSTADSVGRALIGAARTSPEPVDWQEFVGRWVFRLGAPSDDVLNRYGEAPRSRALVQSTNNPAGQAMLGLTSLFAPVTTSNPERSAREDTQHFESVTRAVKAEISAIAGNHTMTDARKEAEIDRLERLIQLVESQTVDQVNRMWK